MTLVHFLKNKILSLSIVSILLCGTLAHAQRGWEVGGWIGSSFYNGDINTTSTINKPGFALGLLARHNFNHRISGTLQVGGGRFGAEDASSGNNFERNRNLSFRSSYIEFSPTLEFNFFHYEHGHRTHNKTPYIFGGLSIFQFNPSAEFNDRRYDLRPLGTEGQIIGQEYNNVSGGWVLGGGFKFDLNHKVSINLGLAFRFLFTDYIDDVSTLYPDNEDLADTRGEIAAALSDRSLVPGLGEANRQRGNANNNDRFSTFFISVVRYFGSISCPSISRPRN